MGGSQWSAWWQLLRAGNVFTAVSNVVAAFLLVQGGWVPHWPLMLLALSSAAMYLSGMVLNDVFDLEVDRTERPTRPLPSGQIDVSHARFVGWGLLATGVLLAAIVGRWLESWLPVGVGAALALSIVGYNAIFKATAFGSIAMGSCRSLNALLGASVVPHSVDKHGAYVYAAALGIYTVGLTLFARDEAHASSQRLIKRSANTLQFAVILLLGLAFFETLPKFGWYFFWLLIVLSARVIAYDAYMDPSPMRVQRSVSQLIMLFIPLDALVATAAAGWFAGMLVLTLLIPTYVATRRIAMT